MPAPRGMSGPEPVLAAAVALNPSLLLSLVVAAVGYVALCLMRRGVPGRTDAGPTHERRKKESNTGSRAR